MTTHFKKNILFLKLFLVMLPAVLHGCREEDKSGYLLGQNNAVWTESVYLRGYKPGTYEPLTIDYLRSYANNLKEHHIKYAYLFAGPYQEDGHLPQFAFGDTAVNTVKLLKEYYPEIVILPWVGGLQNQTVHLEDSLWVRNALEDTKRLINTLKVPGVHIDMEFLLPGDPYLDRLKVPEKPGDREAYGNNMNEFHRKLRDLIPDAFISSVVVATSPETKSWKRKTSMDELGVLIKYIDQLSFLFYDTYINDQQTFQNGCASLIKDIQSLRARKNIQYLIGIGTFINEPELHKYRNMAIENIPNTLKTIKNNILSVSSTKPPVDGIAIYCDWLTEPEEWEQFDKHWGKYDEL